MIHLTKKKQKTNHVTKVARYPRRLSAKNVRFPEDVEKIFTLFKRTFRNNLFQI